jgi:hypothetical protein
MVDSRKALIALTVAVAFVAIVIPTCRMIGCSMDMATMGAMDAMHHVGSGVILSSSCDGEWSTTTSPFAVVPPGLETFLIALFAAVLATVALFSPQVVSRPVHIADAMPPPPLPQDPLGVRFRV